jgi:DNA-binding MarR family transcriptional regulator
VIDEQRGLPLEVSAAQRELGTLNVLFQHVVADRMGLNSTDYRCWQALCDAGPLSAGRLAALVGLTTSAMTGIVDRLEKAGLVLRRADPHDRRRVIVEPIQERRTEVGPLYVRLYLAMSKLCDSFSEAELTVIRDFLRSSVVSMRAELVRLQLGGDDGTAGSAEPPDVPAPRESVADEGDRQ